MTNYDFIMNMFLWKIEGKKKKENRKKRKNMKENKK